MIEIAMVDIANILQLVSFGLSTVTIFLCFFLKLPQINRIYQKKTVAGLNWYSLLFDVCSYSISASYCYLKEHSLMSYLEYPVIILQQFVVIFLYLKYSSRLNVRSLIYFMFYIAAVISICQGILPSRILDIALISCTPVSLSSKILQLWEIWRLRCADSISTTTWALSAFSNYARIYTVILDSADWVLLTNFSISGSLSLCIMLSAQYLQNSSIKIK